MILPSVLVVTTETGEPQLERSRIALLHQQGVTIDHTLISRLPMQEAQSAVHLRTIAAQGRFDYVLKLDGDMVPAHDGALASMVDRSREHGDPARYTEPVYDWYTQSQIEGVHLLRPERVPDEVIIEPPFYDAWVSSLPGMAVKRVDTVSVLHAPDPDLTQAVRFGVQRGTKARHGGARGNHWLRIAQLRTHYLRSGDVRALGALVGAAAAVRPEATSTRTSVDIDSEYFSDLVDVVREDEELARRHAHDLTKRGGILATHLAIHGSPRSTMRLAASFARRRFRNDG